ncbi:hypothetical protein [Paenibacillus sp. LPE1-1-1.1]|uniref:hypothetical protein n=1 Tax=Paenibacillus sp. LPE1-1-1.1 TaxID=3135230 RepID=UPI0034306DA4
MKDQKGTPYPARNEQPFFKVFTAWSNRSSKRRKYRWRPDKMNPLFFLSRFKKKDCPKRLAAFQDSLLFSLSVTSPSLD